MGDPAPIESPDTRRGQRIPPGQARTDKWPVLHYGEVPATDPASWDLRIFGLCAPHLRLSWEDFRALPRVAVRADMHCVTRWSRLDNLWEGASVRGLLARAQVDPAARFVLIHAESGFTTNLALEDLLQDDVLLADRNNGQPLAPEHGGPLRLVVPRLYAWKSAKWVRGIELLAEEVPGFWERNGYHLRGDPWKEERFWGD